jgi:hypothetical protein
MNGEAGVGGELGQGADFWFEAPFDFASRTPADLPLTGRTVAIASPNAMVREAAIRQVRASGGQALAGETVAAALKGAPADAVLLLDAALAGPRGALKAPAGRGCVALLTPDQRDRIPKLKAAGLGYLIKPLRRASLIAQVLAATVRRPRPWSNPPAATAHEDDRIAPAAAPASACCWPRTIRSTPCWPAPCWSARAARSIASPAATRPSRPCRAASTT